MCRVYHIYLPNKLNDPTRTWRRNTIFGHPKIILSPCLGKKFTKNSDENVFHYRNGSKKLKIELQCKQNCTVSFRRKLKVGFR